MGRPRNPNRMSRMVQARVTDAQYDYLADRAYHVHDGDLSAALRMAITLAEAFDEVLNAPDPGEAMRALKAEWEHEYAERRSEMRMDKPGDEANED